MYQPGTRCAGERLALESDTQLKGVCVSVEHCGARSQLMHLSMKIIFVGSVMSMLARYDVTPGSSLVTVSAASAKCFSTSSRSATDSKASRTVTTYACEST